ncbi:MAG: LacI family DNA-binding transcriptional regulator [Ornithinibacter sp.]
MARRNHRVRDIAEQAGLSQATVDRVLHQRPGVSARAVRAVETALLDLDRQGARLRLSRRSLLVDVVLDAPARFRDAVRDAAEGALGSLRPASVRVRFHESDGADPAAVAAVVDAVGSSGRVSHGIVLKAPDAAVVGAAVRRAAGRGIPTVTLVTDVGDSGRIAYVGLDNAAAGETAAYLLGHLVQGRPGPILASVSHRAFLGEQERFAAFRQQLARGGGGRAVLTLTDVGGRDDAMERVTLTALTRHPDVVGVYSMGGGNAGLVRALATVGRAGLPFVAHDLDADNLLLLRSGALTLVLHHDLRADLRAGLTQLLRAHRLVAGAPTSLPSAPQVITPWNVPARLRG